MIFPSRTLSISIDRPPDEVYDFISNPENLPKWAAGLCKSVSKTNADWIAQTPQGSMKIRFAEKNHFGVTDHYVNAAPRVEVYVPMRVLPNGSGSEMIFTMFRLPGMSDDKFAEDIRLLEHDLMTLKNVLERN